MQTGDVIRGKYHGEPFEGTVKFVEPNWEVKSRGAINVLVHLSNFIKTPGREKADDIFLLGLNLSTGLKFSENEYGYHSFEVAK